MMRLRFCLILVCVVVPAQGRGARPTPQIPAPGIEVPAADRAELETGLKQLQSSTEKLRGNPLVADVLIYQEAVRYALQYNEFLKADEIGKARKLLAEGQHETSGKHQCEKRAALRKRRDTAKVTRSLDALKRAAEGTGNTMPHLLDAVRSYATLGEICEVLRGVFGGYTETTHL